MFVTSSGRGGFSNLACSRPNLSNLDRLARTIMVPGLSLHTISAVIHTCTRTYFEKCHLLREMRPLRIQVLLPCAESHPAAVPADHRGPKMANCAVEPDLIPCSFTRRLGDVGNFTQVIAASTARGHLTTAPNTSDVSVDINAPWST